jgi:hypothetical protein
VHHWQSYNKSSTPTQAYCFHMNEVFANCSKEDETYPLTAEEIAEAQNKLTHPRSTSLSAIRDGKKLS